MGENGALMSDFNEYYKPHGYAGVGSDIKWCGTWRTGKHCLLCQHHAEFEEWSKDWKWYYLVDWADHSCGYYRTYIHFKHRWSWHGYAYMGGAYVPYPYRIKPARYRTSGLKERDLMQLLDKGCKPKRKCKCVSIAQRGNWYCPQCWYIIHRMAQYKGAHVHDLMIGDRQELKAEMLILQLSGIL
jgi:hypothetical protein